MPTIDLTTEEISVRLTAAATAVQPGELEAVSEAIGAQLGDLAELSTTDKTNLVSAVNELFISASDGKTEIAAAVTGMGVPTAATDSYAVMAENIAKIKTGLERLVVNDGEITPTGTYATATYYNLDFGVKLGYCPNGDILIAMKSGTTTSYENLSFTLTSAPSGVTITSSSTSWDTANPAGQLYVCVLSGVTVPVSVAIAMSAVNSTYDYTTCAITVTEV